MSHKVLIVSCDGLENGGVQNIIMNIVRSLHNLYHFDILVFNNDDSLYCKEFKTYGTIFRLPHQGAPNSLRRKLDVYIRFPRLYFGVKRILKENGPYDVIHCHNFFEAAPCLMAAKHCGVPVRISHSHNAFPRSHIISELLRYIYRKLLIFYATDKIGCSQIASDYLFGKNKGKALTNAIDLNKFDISRYPKQKKKHSFIHVSRFCVEKNQSFILDVFKIIQEKWKDASLIFVGFGNEAYENELKQKIADLNLKNIEFLPHNSDVPALFAQSEYMIFPSLFEGFGLVLAEAQAMGVKCFASDCIPHDANIGLCEYISLKEPAEVWAKAVFDAENKPVIKPNTEKVSLLNYNNKICSLYNNGKNLCYTK